MAPSWIHCDCGVTATDSSAGPVYAHSRCFHSERFQLLGSSADGPVTGSFLESFTFLPARSPSPSSLGYAAAGRQDEFRKVFSPKIARRRPGLFFLPILRRWRAIARVQPMPCCSQELAQCVRCGPSPFAPCATLDLRIRSKAPEPRLAAANKAWKC